MVIPTVTHRNRNLARIPNKIGIFFNRFSRAYVKLKIFVKLFSLSRGIAAAFKRAFDAVALGNNAPLVFSYYAPLVAVPANVGSDKRDYGAGLIFAHCVIIAVPIVLLNIAVFIGLCSSVKSYIKNVAVVCKKLF